MTAHTRPISCAGYTGTGAGLERKAEIASGALFRTSIFIEDSTRRGHAAPNTGRWRSALRDSDRVLRPASVLINGQGFLLVTRACWRDDPVKIAATFVQRGQLTSPAGDQVEGPA